MRGRQDTRRPLLDHWQWERPIIILFVTIGTAVPVLASVTAFLFVGLHALWVLMFCLIGILNGIVYAAVGKRVSRLAATMPKDEGIIIEALIVRDVIEAPGVILLGPDSMILQPVVGERSDVSKSDLSDLREVSWFNGQLLIGKTGFWFAMPDGRRLACAVPNSRADEFRAWLPANG